MTRHIDYNEEERKLIERQRKALMIEDSQLSINDEIGELK